MRGKDRIDDLVGPTTSWVKDIELRGQDGHHLKLTGRQAAFLLRQLEWMTKSTEGDVYAEGTCGVEVRKTVRNQEPCYTIILLKDKT